MLDLQPRVHLQKVEALVLADHELDRARALVVHRFGQRHRLFTHGLSRGLGDERRWRFLDHLLVAALDRTFALPQIDHIAMRIAQHLDLDMARLLDIFLDEDPVVAEARACLIAAGRETLEAVLVVESHAQALASATGAGLDHDRVPHPPGNLDRIFGAQNRLVVPRNCADMGRVGELFRGDLVAHRADRIMLGADEGQALFFDAARERFVLAQEAVAGMDGLRARALGRGNDLVGHQIGLSRRRRPEQHGLVGQLHMARVAVGLGIDRHRLDAHLPGGLDNAAGDFTPVRDQNLLKHFDIPG